jgi:hypothetical protein
MMACGLLPFSDKANRLFPVYKKAAALTVLVLGNPRPVAIFTDEKQRIVSTAIATGRGPVHARVFLLRFVASAWISGSGIFDFF